MMSNTYDDYAQPTSRADSLWDSVLVGCTPVAYALCEVCCAVLERLVSCWLHKRRTTRIRELDDMQAWLEPVLDALCCGV